jgi:hypothetical protein
MLRSAHCLPNTARVTCSRWAGVTTPSEYELEIARLEEISARQAELISLLLEDGTLEAVPELAAFFDES